MESRIASKSKKSSVSGFFFFFPPRESFFSAVAMYAMLGLPRSFLGFLPRGLVQGLPVLAELEQLYVEAQGLKLLDEDLEGLRHAGLRRGLALDDGLVHLRPPVDVVGLDRQELLKGVGRPVALDGPDFHFAEALAAELGLASEGLARDEAVRSGRARVDLVLDQMDQLEDV